MMVKMFLSLLLSSFVVAAEFAVDGDQFFRETCYQSDVQAVRLFRPLADQGDAEAQYNLAVMYIKGCGVPRSHAEAVHWLILSAEQGFAKAFPPLARIYIDHGHSAAKKNPQAVYWLQKAVQQGDATAQNILDEMLQNDEVN